MKSEMGESLCYSWLRHVKQCWLVQTNWKSSEHWETYRSSDELEAMFRVMKDRFDMEGDVFKQNKSARQFMKQGEVDVVGVDPEGGVHALDVAFHESGLLYGGGGSDSSNRILKKLLRMYILLHAYRPPGTPLHMYFVSPKVHDGPQAKLEETFGRLRLEYPESDWHLITNDHFTEQVVRDTLSKTAEVADTAELFVRAAKLLNLSGALIGTRNVGGRARTASESEAAAERLQPLVRALMRTLLVDHPTLLDDSDRRNLMDADYCKGLGLRIGFNLPLLRKRESGTQVHGHDRYWKEPFGGFHVCSQWWRDDHVENAKRLSNVIQDVARKKPGHVGLPALRRHMQALRDYAR